MICVRTDDMPHFPTTSTPLTNGSQDAPSAIQQSTDDARAVSVRVKNRRKRYLDLHPDYFTDRQRELTDPLLYDRLVRRYLTVQEREQMGRERGFARLLEADVVRSEARLDAVEHPDPNETVTYVRQDDGTIAGEVDEEEMGQTKEQAWLRWVDILTQRFLLGHDRDFEYDTVDTKEEYDDVVEEERGRLESYLGEQQAEFVGSGSPQGQTGIQDY